MALLYPWATKEYLLWEMSLPQIILYHNLGLEIKYPKDPAGEKSSEEVKKIKEEMIKTGLIERKDEKKEELRRKYGSID